jgi:acetyl esterase/lipase
VANGGAIARLVLGGIFAILVPLALGVNDARAGVGVLERPAIEYTPGQALDLFLPDDRGGPVPAVLFVHGGGWRTGGRTSWADEARRLVAGTGWAAATVDYDLRAAQPWVTQPADVRAAIVWVRTHAAAFGIDPARIALVGSSAGGHLSMLVATAGSGPLTIDDRVAAVVSWSGVSDLPRLARSPVAEPLVKDLAARFNGGSLDDEPARWMELSPVAHVDATDPPMLLAHSAQETLVPVDQALAMRDALRDNGVEVETVVLPGTAHASDYEDRVWGQTIAFLRAHL